MIWSFLWFLNLKDNYLIFMNYNHFEIILQIMILKK